MNCTWPNNDLLMTEYHNNEWGVPVHDDKKHFEFLILDSFQAGLSWKTILHKRQHFKKAFANFDVKKVAAFTNTDVERLMQDVGIIRNALKINASIKNAQLFMEVQKEFGSFDNYIWQFVDGKTIQNNCQSNKDIKATSIQSDLMSADLKKRGFKFVGSTICYAYMQAAGLVNDHLVTCSHFNNYKK